MGVITTELADVHFTAARERRSLVPEAQPTI